MSKDRVAIDVLGGMCQITFSPGCSSGPDDDTNPGVGFDLTSDVPAIGLGGKYSHGTGVIGRKDAERLRDMLEIFLKSHARGEQH